MINSRGGGPPVCPVWFFRSGSFVWPAALAVAHPEVGGTHSPDRRQPVTRYFCGIPVPLPVRQVIGALVHGDAGVCGNLVLCFVLLRLSGLRLSSVRLRLWSVRPRRFCSSARVCPSVCCASLCSASVPLLLLVACLCLSVCSSSPFPGLADLLVFAPQPRSSGIAQWVLL